MRKLLSITLVFILLQMAFKCEDQHTLDLQEATIVNSGPVAADGCGWLILIDEEEYSPTNLEEQYQKAGLKVKVEARLLDTEFQCGMNPDHKLPMIEIISIN